MWCQPAHCRALSCLTELAVRGGERRGCTPSLFYLGQNNNNKEIAGALKRKRHPCPKCYLCPMLLLPPSTTLLTPAGPLGVQLVAAMINGHQTDKSTLSLLLSLHKHAAKCCAPNIDIRTHTRTHTHTEGERERQTLRALRHGWKFDSIRFNSSRLT